MILRRLELANFRNYRTLDVDLGPGVTVIAGDNAQGKTNLLEAIYLLATTRSPRTTSESDFVNWQAAREESPVTRIAGAGEGARGPVEVELVIAARPSARYRPPEDAWPGETEDRPPEGLSVSKRIRLNGIARRASDVIGAIGAVFFSTLDMDVICGAPSMRRRYLDLMLSQVDRAYIGALGRYTKVLSQRNALLKRIQEGSAAPSELDFWDGELSKEGGVILCARAGAVAALSEQAAAAHGLLSAGREKLGVRYQPRLGDEDGAPWLTTATSDEAGNALSAGLLVQRPRECAAGMTLLGPHRDDVLIVLGAAEVAAFGSRAQQRSAALALRLAEAKLIAERSGEQPVILLDDVLSELDQRRQRAVIEAMSECPQVLVTTAEPERFPVEFLAASRLLNVRAGELE